MNDSTRAATPLHYLRRLPLACFLFSLGVAIATPLINYKLGTAGFWPSGELSDPDVGLHTLLSCLSNTARWGVFLFFWPTLAVGLARLGKWRYWPRWGWVSGALLGGLVLLILHGPLGRLDWVRQGQRLPESPLPWLASQVQMAINEWLLWLGLAAVFIFLHWVGAASVQFLSRRWRPGGAESAPLESPLWSSPRMVATVSAALGGLALGSGGIAQIGMSQDGEVLSVASFTGLLSAVVVALSVRLPKSSASAGVICVIGAISAAILCTPLSFLAASAFDVSFGSTAIRPLTLASLAASIGVVIAAPLGLVFGAAYLVPVLTAHRLERTFALERLDTAFVVMGMWLVVVGGICLAVASTGVIRPSSSALPTWVSAIALLTGTIASFVGAVRMRWRRHWLRRVARGDVQDWSIASLDDIVEPPPGLRPFLSTRAISDALLLHHLPARGKGAYRRGVHRAPCALISRASIALRP